MFVRAKKRGPWTYLMVVENQWVDGRVRQTVLHSLGRLDVMMATGKLDGLIVSATRFSERLAVLGAHKRGETLTTRKRQIGPALVFERLWRELGIERVLSELLAARRFEFSTERAVFLTVLHRLFDPGSDRAAEKWKEAYAIAGADDLALHHLYRAMAWLGTPLPDAAQEGATPFAPRCWKDRVEEELFARRRDLLTGLDIVFFDTTSIYFEGEGGESIGQYGRSKDHRSDRKQMVVGMVLDSAGTPICSEMWPGNTTDVKSWTGCGGTSRSTTCAWWPTGRRSPISKNANGNTSWVFACATARKSATTCSAARDATTSCSRKVRSRKTPRR